MAQSSIWIWAIYRPDSTDILGAIRRCERARWTSHEARDDTLAAAAELKLGHVRWDLLDERTEVGRSDLGYVCVITSVLLPDGE
jgi:hypothetical protein